MCGRWCEMEEMGECVIEGCASAKPVKEDDEVVKGRRCGVG